MKPLPPHQADVRARQAIVEAAVQLFADGETTEGLVRSIDRLAKALDAPVRVIPQWEGLVFDWSAGLGADGVYIRAVRPLGVHLGRAAAMVDWIERTAKDRLARAQALIKLGEIVQIPAVSALRFCAMCAAGAVALAVIFGVLDVRTLLLVALCAGVGAALRRSIAGYTSNPFVQPFVAAALAGGGGALAIRWAIPAPDYVALCPCMVLVPGPHLLNGAIDLARARIALGLARLGYGGVIVLAISGGLLIGLALGGYSLVASAPLASPPYSIDLLAAGVAVAAYGTFYSLSWRDLPVPVGIGIVAHGAHRALVDHQVAGEVATFVACATAGVLATIAARARNLPFAGLAFASVVSLMPGVYVFHAVASAVALATRNGPAADLAAVLVTNSSTATITLGAMSVGLVLSHLCFKA